MKQIGGHIDPVRDVVSNIAATAASQAKHFGEFKSTIREIDRSTQLIAAIAEKSKAAYRTLEDGKREAHPIWRSRGDVSGNIPYRLSA
ncbi:MAG: hypothetical protein EOS58_32525 [Mesorhizobium sp.]|uniref:hypothetical protein n=1 Tax=Mesorhizobium sp. TaxID=1871066 RepID=UPI000FE82954|nr:hypothetical protein [Mesorhizobium sp.]RWC99188.1 MAG: hypothetical protein EOS58_32525 [Mesorhizobium sp.]RWD79548.1 MAG: hypothetical protein EOS38_31475 [Mesorhizobium sp.]RWD80715.1 MAG: hypothetical protein EOS39_31515 [Mesorhizobium sp.]TJW65996.1 MAG: hypothetical protein E5V29_24300 [Mesorhizobium sp.]